MGRQLVSFLIICAVAASLSADEQANAPFMRLPRKELEKLEGVWLLTFDTKEGWKGTLTAKVKLYLPEQIEAGCGTIRYDYEYARGKEKRSGYNIGGFSFAGVQRGKTKSLVRVDASDLDEKQIPPEAKRSGEGLMTYSVGETMKLDATKALRSFFSVIEEVDLDWSKLEFKRVKQK